MKSDQKSHFQKIRNCAPLEALCPPLPENHGAQKNLLEWGVGSPPPPLAEKIREVAFDRFP